MFFWINIVIISFKRIKKLKLLVGFYEICIKYIGVSSIIKATPKVKVIIKMVKWEYTEEAFKVE